MRGSSSLRICPKVDIHNLRHGRCSLLLHHLVHQFAHLLPRLGQGALSCLGCHVVLADLTIDQAVLPGQVPVPFHSILCGRGGGEGVLITPPDDTLTRRLRQDDIQ